MPQNTFSLREKDINRIFPFNFRLDKNLQIRSVGDALQKVIHLRAGQNFHDCFTILSPLFGNAGYKELSNANRDLNLRYKNNEAIVLRGEFLKLELTEDIVYLGEPWLHQGIDESNETIEIVSSLQITQHENDIKDHYMEMAYSFTKSTDVGRFGTNIDQISPIVLCDAKGHIEWVNKAFEIKTGFSLDDAYGKRPRAVLYGENSIKLPEDYVDKRIKNHKPFSFENIGYKKDGSTFWFKSTIFPVLNDNKQLVGRFSVIEDITASREVSMRSIENRKMWDFAMENAGHGAWVFDYQTYFISVSDHYKKMLGYGKDVDFNTQLWSESIHPDDLNIYNTEITPKLTPDEPFFNYEHRLKIKGGDYQYFFSRGKVVLWDDDQKPSKIIGTLTNIQESKNKDAEILAAAERISVLIKNLNSAILIEKENRTILLTNQKFCTLFRIPASPEALTGADCSDSAEQSKLLFNEPDTFVNRINEILTNKTPVLNEIVEMADGTTLQRDYIPIMLPDGNYKGHLWNYRDITAEKKLENQLRTQKEFYDTILNETPGEIVAIAVDKRYIYLSRSAVKNDETRNWLLGKTDYDYCNYKKIGNELADKRSYAVSECMKTGLTTRLLEKFTKPDGSAEYKLREFYPRKNGKGEVDMIIGYGIEITEQIESENKIRLHKEYFHSILNNIPADIVVLNPDHTFSFVNKNAIKNNEIRNWAIGRSSEEYGLLRGLATDLINEREATFRAVIKYKKSQQKIEEFKKADGSSTYMLRILNPIIDDYGKVECVIVSGIDVTDQIKNKEYAELQEKRVRNLLENINDGVIRCDIDGNINLYNPAFVKMMTMNLLKGLGTKTINFFELLSDEEATRLKKITGQVLITRQAESGILQLGETGADARYINFTLTPVIREEDGSFIGVFSDVTAVMNKEKDLQKIIRKEKELNQYKSQFIRITSHELRTPLSIILSNVEILDMINNNKTGELAISPDKMIGRIVKEVNTMTDVLNQLMMISKIEEDKMDAQREPVDIEAYLVPICKELYTPYTDGRSLVLELGQDLGELLLDKKLFLHALINVINNAFKYSEGKSAPILRVKKLNNAIEIEVQDWGIGIPEKDIPKLFNSFFRASNVGSMQGTGLGLTVIDYVVKKHGGTIRLNTRLNKGTVFNIKLPKA